MTAHPQAEPLTAPTFPRRAFARLPEVRPLGAVAGLLGTAAIVAMVIEAVRIATAATATPKLLVPSGRHGMPSWMAGVFQGTGSLISIPELVRLILTISVLYVVVLVFSRWIPTWAAFSGATVLIAIFTPAPPLFSTDIFNYVAYARMGTLYHVNPYLHGAASIAADPSVPFTGPKWLRTPTAYGPLFTLISYALVPLGVAGAVGGGKGLPGAAARGCG